MTFSKHLSEGSKRLRVTKSNEMPKGSCPSLIVSTNGRPKRVQVERRSGCTRCNGHIEAGQDCFGIPKLGSGFATVKRFCGPCFQAIIKQTEKDLEEVRKL